MKHIKFLAILILIIFAGYVFVAFYPFLFAKTVIGTIEKVERVQLNVALMQTTPGKVSPELYSFAVAIREKGGKEIYTSSSEDRQWAVAQTGQCVEAKFYPYPFWNLEKAGTYYNARLIKLSVCE